MIPKVNYLSENLRIGKRVLTSFNKTFPNLESCSMTQLECIKAKSPKIKKSLSQHSEELALKVGVLKKEVYSQPYNSFSEYLIVLKNIIKKYNVADCGHRTDVIRGLLRKENKDAKMVEMVICDSFGKQKSNHIFPVISLKNTSNINNPESWGENAVIVDAWANFVMKASDGINHLKEIIKFMPNNEQIRFNIKA